MDIPRLVIDLERLTYAYTRTLKASKAFELIKIKFTTTLILVLPDFHFTFEFHSDTLKIGINVILSQQGWPIAYYNEILFGSTLGIARKNVEFYEVF